MEAIERISLYNALFYVSMGVAILGLILATFFFFYFDIPAVYAMMTGKARKETIRRMEEQNAKTGKLRISMSGSTGKAGRPGKIGRTEQQREEPAIQSVSYTNVRTTEGTRPETAVLNVQIPETAVLQATAPETTVLQNGMPAAAEEDCGKTEILHPAEKYFRFLVTETTLVIHTDEVI